MSEENDLDFQTFQVYPDDEPVKSKNPNNDKKTKKTVTSKTGSDKTVGKSKFTSKKSKSSLSMDSILKKINPVVACVIGLGIAFIYIAFDILTSI